MPKRKKAPLAAPSVVSTFLFLIGSELDWTDPCCSGEFWVDRPRLRRVRVRAHAKAPLLGAFRDRSIGRCHALCRAGQSDSECSVTAVERAITGAVSCHVVRATALTVRYVTLRLITYV